MRARTGGFRRDLNRARRDVASFTKALSGVRRMTLGLIGFGGFTALARGVLNTGKELTELSARFGESTGKMFQLRQLARNTGVDFTQLTTAMQRLSRRVAEAHGGNAKLAETFESLGLNVDKLFNMKPTEQFAALADALSKVTNQNERLQKTFTLLDSEGVKAMSAFSNATGEFNKQMKAAEGAQAAGKGVSMAEKGRGVFSKALGFIEKEFFATLGLFSSKDALKEKFAGLGSGALKGLEKFLTKHIPFKPDVVQQGGAFTNRGQLGRSLDELNQTGKNSNMRTLEELNATSKKQLATLEELSRKYGPRAQ